MNLILWRHAEAEDGNPRGDLARELTKRGRKQSQQMAHWLDAHLEGDWKILVSPAVRTLQTMEALDRKFDVSDALAPGAGAAKVLRATGWPGDGGNVLVVGHQPTLGEVASAILGGEEGGLSIRKGAIWWFESREREGKIEAIVKTVLEPDQAED